MSRLMLAASGLVLALVTSADAAPRPVTVFLDRNGRTVDLDGEEVTIPKFGGGDQAWSGMVGCVKAQFAPFQIDVVDTRPRSGDFISAVVGGLASQMGLDDRSTNGVGPYIPGRVQPNAVVHIFSKVSGERDAQNLCAVTVHEVSHALGLDHTYKCGDIMSYFLDRCGARKFMDVDAPCGEFSARVCGDGGKTQNSYRMIANAVGLRQPDPKQPQPTAPPMDDDDDDEPATTPTQPTPTQPTTKDPDDSDDTADEPAQEQPRRRTTVERYRDRSGRTWVITRTYR